MTKLLVLWLLVLAAVLIHAEKICEPGAVIKQDCNTCRCSASGDQLACTRKMCSLPSRNKRATCRPGTTWQQDCNTCSCTGSGFPVCTLKACLPRFRRQVAVQQESSSLPTETCEPGSTFKKECNDCVCSADGRTAACTTRACLILNRKRRGVLHEYSSA